MFDETKAIAAWRGRLAETGTLFEADLDELESHLHDHLEGLEEVGITGESAFLIATERLGETRALADEFAKVNPLLAWRAALFWISAGVMLVLGLKPVQDFAIHGAVAAAMALHLQKPLVTILMWAVTFGSPLAFFAIAFWYARRHVEAPLPSARHAVVRVGLIVGCAVLMLAAHLGLEWGWLVRYEYRWSGATIDAAGEAIGDAYYALAIAAPLFLGGMAYRQRALVLQDRTSAAPLFWLAVGLFIGSVRCELHRFVRHAAFAGGGLAHLGADQMGALMWVVTLGCPLMLFASTYAYLRHRAPGPTRLVRARGVLLAMACSGAIAIAAVFATGPVSGHAYSLLTPDAMFAGFRGWLFAGIVMSCALPVLVGTIMLRLRSAASLAAFRHD